MAISSVSMHTANSTGSSRIRKWLNPVILGLLASGIAGTSTVSCIEQAAHQKEIAQINELREKDYLTIAKLSNEMGSIMHKDESQAEQMIRLKEELGFSREAIENLTTQVNILNRDLSSRITLDQMMKAVSTVAPSTVRVEGMLGLGSGVIIKGNHGERYILTNGHVTKENEFKRGEFRDSVYHIKVYNGTDYDKPIEFDAAPVILSKGERSYSPPEKHDLALLLIPPDVNLPPNLEIKMRNIEEHPLRVGEPVFAIGNPFGERDTVTFGSISHIDRQADLNINHHIQTDAPINPGNSGGGLFSIRIVGGKPQVELIGINTWGYRGGDGIAGSIRVDYIQKVFKDWGIKIS